MEAPDFKRICIKCNVLKDILEFKGKGVIKSTKFNKTCRQCTQSEYQHKVKNTEAKGESIRLTYIDGCKNCKRCQQSLPLSNFYKKKSMRDGFNNVCKACSRENRQKKRTKLLEKNILLSENKICEKCEKKKSLEKFGIRITPSGEVNPSWKIIRSWVCTECSSFAYNQKLQAHEKQDKVLIDSKMCRKCKQTQSIANFYADKTSLDKKSKYCMTCDKQSKAQGYKKRKDFDREEKRNKQCENCGTLDANLLEWAHTKPEEKSRTKSGKPETPSKLSIKAFINEKNIIRLLCRNCHRRETASNLKEDKNLSSKRRGSEKTKDLHVKKRKLEIGACVDCQIPVSGDYFSVFEFDHLPQFEKIACIYDMRMNAKYTIADIDAEIAKCELVCASCHKIRTDKRREEAKKLMSVE